MATYIDEYKTIKELQDKADLIEACADSLCIEPCQYDSDYDEIITQIAQLEQI
jgi:hypothetical protein